MHKHKPRSESFVITTNLRVGEARFDPLIEPEKRDRCAEQVLGFHQTFEEENFSLLGDCMAAAMTKNAVKKCNIEFEFRAGSYEAMLGAVFDRCMAAEG